MSNGEQPISPKPGNLRLNSFKYGSDCSFKYADRDSNCIECNCRRCCDDLLKPIMESVASEKKTRVFPLLSDTLWHLASAPEDLLGGGGWLLHGGADRHLYVPVQKCVWAVQADHGHVRGRVSFCAQDHVFKAFSPLISSEQQTWDFLFIKISLHLFDLSDFVI